MKWSLPGVTMANQRVLWERDNVKCIFFCRSFTMLAWRRQNHSRFKMQKQPAALCVAVSFQLGVPAAVDEPASSCDWIDIQPIRGANRDVGSVTSGDWLGRLLVPQNHVVKGFHARPIYIWIRLQGELWDWLCQANITLFYDAFKSTTCFHRFEGRVKQSETDFMKCRSEPAKQKCSSFLLIVLSYRLLFPCGINLNSLLSPWVFQI